MSNLSHTQYADLEDRLAKGWDAGLDNAVRDVSSLLAKAFATEVAVTHVGNNEAVMRMSLKTVRLHNFDEVYIVLVGGSTSRRRQLADLRYRFQSEDRLLLVLAPEAEWKEDLDTIFPARSGFMTMTMPQAEALMTGDDAIEKFRLATVQNISRYALNPFNVLRVPRANMFFGRSETLEMLIQTADTSWAIAGPARIGKSTVLQHYEMLVRKRDPVRAQCLVRRDFYYVNDYSDTTISREIAMAVNPTNKAAHVTLSDLRGFLVKERNLRHGRLELLFDEVDRVCSLKPFLLLGECAKDGICRLILCGKSALNEVLNDPQNQLHGRLRLLRLEPFRPDEGRRLFLEPLRDLGLTVIDEAKIVAEVLADTSGYPHLIQYLGVELVRQAVEDSTDTIDAGLFAKVRDKYETSQFFLAPIQKLVDEEAELLALSMLHSQNEKFSEGDIRKLAAREGLRLDEKQIAVICRHLYINNVLSWHGDYFQIATGGQRRYARKLGYYGARLLELRRKIGRSGS